jgi:hypothetical protein
LIRIRRLTPALLDAWLVDQRLPGQHARYRLRLWRDDATALPALRVEMRAYIEEAFEDARRRLRSGFQDPLSPFNVPHPDPAANYPAALNRVTLQGYFGETLAALAVEHWGAANHQDWQVPAFLFRFHDQEFQHLDEINQRLADGELHDRDAQGEQRPGRTGDDALAFRRNAQSAITHVMTLEAKCLSQNRNDKIEDAHRKLAEAGPRPNGIRELVTILQDYDTPEANSWQQSLVEFWRTGYRTATRYDGVSYVTGHIPARGARQAWLPNQPHAVYTAARHLDGIEFQFADLDRVIDELYR